MDVLKNTIGKFDNLVFLSPHMDDAILSAGYLMARLFRSRKNIILITIFTKAKRKSVTPQALDFLSKCGIQNAIQLFKLRTREDIMAAKMFNAKLIHLDFIDAAWRLDNNRSPIYKDQREQFSGIISYKESGIINKIVKVLIKKIPNDNKTIIIAPVGIGYHVDHIIMNCVSKTFNHPKIYWTDYPYCNNRYNFIQKLKNYFRYKTYFVVNSKGTGKIKETAVKKYHTQLKSLFTNSKIKFLDERYYLDRRFNQI